MATEILAFWTPGPLEVIIVLAVFGLFVIIPAVLIVLLVVFLLKNNKERQTLRLKVEKLADELERTQEQLQSQKKDESSV